MLMSTGSRSHIIPGALMFGILGLIGQGTYNFFQDDQADEASKLPLSDRILQSRYIPLKRLSDDDYIQMLSEKTMKIDAEITMIDEKVSTLLKSKTKDP
jgi:hypothetical protein